MRCHLTPLCPPLPLYDDDLLLSLLVLIAAIFYPDGRDFVAV